MKSNEYWLKLHPVIRMGFGGGLIVFCSFFYFLVQYLGVFSWIFPIIVFLFAWLIGAFQQKNIVIFFSKFFLLSVYSTAMLVFVTHLNLKWSEILELIITLPVLPTIVITFLCLLVFIQTWSIPEWLYYTGKKLKGKESSFLQNSIIATATTVSSLIVILNREKYSCSCTREWRYRFLNMTFWHKNWQRVDECFSIFIYHMYEVMIASWDNLENLRQLKKKIDAGVSHGYPCLQLNTIYQLPFFHDLYAHVSGSSSIIPLWLEVIKKNVPKGKVLIDVGSGTGRLSKTLYRQGFSIVALEADTDFIQKSHNNFSRDGSDNSFVVINEPFPSCNLAPYKPHALVFHQNVLVEILCAYSLEQFIDGVYKALEIGGIAIFDYPGKIKLPPMNTFVSLVDNLKIETGIFNYGYELLKNNNNKLLARLTYEYISPENLTIIERPLLKAEIVDISKILNAFIAKGFSLEFSSPLKMDTFLPGEMQIYVIRRQK